MINISSIINNSIPLGCPSCQEAYNAAFIDVAGLFQWFIGLLVVVTVIDWTVFILFKRGKIESGHFMTALYATIGIRVLSVFSMLGILFAI